MQDVVLAGRHVRLKPLEHRHRDALAAAEAGDDDLYRWSPVPKNEAEAAHCIETALSWKQGGTAVPFAIARLNDEVVIGSTRLWSLERWMWPEGHSSHGRTDPDACEIGYTWLARPAIRTGANTEAKLLLLNHAFETWRVLRVCLHADARN